MSLYIQISDFKQQTNVAKDIFTKPELQGYIDKFEVSYLQELLGSDLYNDFATDFAITGTSPTDPKFVEIWNPFCIDDSCGIKRSEGILEMLSLFIYFEFLRDQPIKNNISGPTQNEQANSSAPQFSQTNVFNNYNEAVMTYRAIQWIICDNPNGYDWTKFNGIGKDVIGYI